MLGKSAQLLTPPEMHLAELAYETEKTLGIIGLGRVGKASALIARGFGMRVLYSSPTRRPAAEQPGDLAYAALDELLADPSVQVVHVTSPNVAHYGQVKAILSAGKHVICEKPLAMTSAQSAEMLAMAKASGKVAGRQTLMRIDAANGVIEIGNIYWGPPMAQRPAATEALYLFAKHVFDDLGYRRFEWKCDALNAPSRKAAERFGFRYEGTFRKAVVYKGRSRDTAWLAITDDEWPAVAAAHRSWLAPENFDTAGRQRTRLTAPTKH